MQTSVLYSVQSCSRFSITTSTWKIATEGSLAKTCLRTDGVRSSDKRVLAAQFSLLIL